MQLNLCPMHYVEDWRMSRSTNWITSLAVLFVLFSCSASNSAELDEHLRFLEPLIGSKWEGGFVGEDPPNLVISLYFESILEGKAVKYSRTAAAAEFLSEMLFYWSPNRGEVSFINLNSRGIVSEGVVKSQDGDVVLLGELHWPESSTEFKTVLHIDSTGVLKDTFTRKEDGTWVPGHLQEFVARQ